jgi:hypothetical protein
VIVASLLLIAGAATMLVLGLWQSSSVLLSGSIAASLLAAIVLVVGARRAAAGPPAGRATTGEPLGRAAADAPVGEPPVRSDPAEANTQTLNIPVQAKHGGPGHDAGPGGSAGHGAPAQEHPTEFIDEVDPPDEPAPQQVSAADAARVGRMHTEVLVVDGRPRYHLPGCVHLLGRESEPLPVGEAVGIGFTPCSLCEPDSALLADARRV